MAGPPLPPADRSSADLPASGHRFGLEETVSLLVLVWVALALVAAQLWQVTAPEAPSSTPRAPITMPRWVWPLVVLSLGLFSLFASSILGSGRRHWQALWRRPIDEPGARPHVFLETTVLFLLLSSIVGVVVGELSGPGTLWPLWLQWSLAMVFLWPVLRAVPTERRRHALGWSLSPAVPRGPQRGPGRRLAIEAAWGLAAYVGAWPVLACAAALSAWLATHWASAHHPVADWIRTAAGFDRWTVLMIALVWAPLMEETLFRGAFFHYLRSRWSVGTAALVSASLFALLHPQGPAGWPFLMTLGVILALLRHARGSIVAGLTMHCVHNGVTLSLLTSFP